MSIPGLSVGFLGAGEMGAALGRAMIRGGFQVASVAPGRSQATLERMDEAGIAAVDSLEELVDRCNVLFSVLPTDQAYDVAFRISRLAKNLAAPLTFVEANAISPGLVARISELFARLPVEFIDAGIVGSPPDGIYRPRLYASGPNLEVLRQLDGSGFQLVAIDEIIGTASAFKMTYAAMTKGSNTLLTAVMLAANAHGFLDLFLDEASHSQADLLARARSNVSRLPCDAGRWQDEMRQIADSFGEIGLPQGFHQGAEEIMMLLDDSPFGEETRRCRDRNRSLESTIRGIPVPGSSASAGAEPTPHQHVHKEQTAEGAATRRRQ